MSNSAPEGRKTRRIFRPSGAKRLPTNYPGLAPGATFLSRSAAGTAAQQSPKMANLQRADIDRRKGGVAREGETRKSGSFNFRIIGGLNQPPRLRPLWRLRGISLMGAATPPYPRRGIPAHSVFLVCCKLPGQIRISELGLSSLRERSDENTFTTFRDDVNAGSKRVARTESAAWNSTSAACSALAGRQIEPWRTSGRNRSLGARRNRSIVCKSEQCQSRWREHSSSEQHQN